MTLLAHKGGETAFRTAFMLFAAACAFLAPLPSAIAADKWVSTGFGGSEDSLYSYGGFTYAPLGTLDESGPRVKAWSKAFRFTYETTNAAGNEVEIAAYGLGLEGELGWQIIRDDWRAAVYAGAVWRDFELKPNDPGSDLAKQKLGASLAIESSITLGWDWHLNADARYTLLFDELWAQLKPEYELDNGMRFGLSASTSKGKDYLITRAALTAGGFKYALPWIGDAYFSAEAGYEFNVDTGKGGPFAGFHIGFAR